MGFEDWFKFVNKEERREKSRQYQQKIFPLGIGQKDAALNTLRPLIKQKIKNDEVLFFFIVSKQKYMESTKDIMVSWQYLKKRKILSNDEKKYILALVLLDIEATSLAGYPSSEDVRLGAETNPALAYCENSF